jgi:vacuolar-type H+-ATPase subunit H
VNETHIQQILVYEQKASEIYEAALKEAAQLPQMAEQEMQAMIAKARLQAEEEARALLNQAETDEECAHILDQLAEKLSRTEKLAKMNYDRAVDYALARVIGMEPR